MNESAFFPVSATAITCMALFLWNAALFAKAIQQTFTRPNGLPRMMFILSMAGVLGVLVDVASMLTATHSTWWQQLSGLCLLTASQLLFRAALRATRQKPLSLAFSTDLPVFVNQSGPFRRIRHPFYAAYSLTWLAAWIITGHLAAAAILALMSTFYLAAALQEEHKFLRGPLAADYLAYRQHTGMFLPSIASLPKIPSQPS